MRGQGMWWVNNGIGEGREEEGGEGKGFSMWMVRLGMRIQGGEGKKLIVWLKVHEIRR